MLNFLVSVLFFIIGLVLGFYLLLLGRRRMLVTTAIICLAATGSLLALIFLGDGSGWALTEGPDWLLLGITVAARARRRSHCWFRRRRVYRPLVLRYRLLSRGQYRPLARTDYLLGRCGHSDHWRTYRALFDKAFRSGCIDHDYRFCRHRYNYQGLGPKSRKEFYGRHHYQPCLIWIGSPIRPVLTRNKGR